MGLHSDVRTGRISAHKIANAMVEYYRGKLTAKQVKDLFPEKEVVGGTDIDKIIAELDSKATDIEKIKYLMGIEASTLLTAEVATYEEADLKASLDISDLGK